MGEKICGGIKNQTDIDQLTVYTHKSWRAAQERWRAAPSDRTAKSGHDAHSGYRRDRNHALRRVVTAKKDFDKGLSRETHGNYFCLPHQLSQLPHELSVHTHVTAQRRTL
jgi:hypothetical protein